jgi:hypothetical protein
VSLKNQHPLKNVNTNKSVDKTNEHLRNNPKKEEKIKENIKRGQEKIVSKQFEALEKQHVLRKE